MFRESNSYGEPKLKPIDPIDPLTKTTSLPFLQQNDVLVSKETFPEKPTINQINKYYKSRGQTRSPNDDKVGKIRAARSLAVIDNAKSSKTRHIKRRDSLHKVKGTEESEAERAQGLIDIVSSKLLKSDSEMATKKTSKT